MWRQRVGIAVIAMCGAGVPSAQAANLLLNPAFQSGTFADWSVTCVGQPSDCVISPTISFDGTDTAAFLYGGTLSQTVTDVAGQTMEAGAWFQDGSGPAPDPNSIEVDGHTVSGPFSPGIDFSFFDGTFTATGSDTVTFNLSAGGGVLFFDDAIVAAVPVQVPEPSGLAVFGAAALGLSLIMATGRRPAG